MLSIRYHGEHPWVREEEEVFLLLLFLLILLFQLLFLWRE